MMPEPTIQIHKNGNRWGYFEDDFGQYYQPITVPNFPPTVADRLQPHNAEAEEAVIGSILIDHDAIIRVSGQLEPEDFYVKRLGWIYESMLELHRQRKPAGDLLLLTDLLKQAGRLDKIGGSVYLSGLINATPTSVHIDYYAGLVIDAADRRRLIESAGHIVRLAYDEGDIGELKDQASSIVLKAANRGRQQKTIPAFDAISMAIDRIEYLCQNPQALIGIPSGIPDLDRLTGGFQRGDYVIVAGRPSMGKTSLALFMALHAAKKFGKRVGIFTLEMNDQKLTQRLLAAESGIDSQRIKLGDIREGEWPKLLDAANTLAGLNLFITYWPGMSAMAFRSEAMRLHAEHGLDMIVIDYIQLMSGDRRSQNREQEISFISRNIKNLAGELNIPVIALSQLSRKVEERGNKIPLMSDLRESGSLEQDGDVIIFPYRPAYYDRDHPSPNMCDMIIGKNREGPTGAISTYFDLATSQFYGLEVSSQTTDYAPMPTKTAGEVAGGFVREKML